MGPTNSGRSTSSGPADLRVVVVAEQLRRRVPGGIGTYIRALGQGLQTLTPPKPEVTFWASRAPNAEGPDPVAELGTAVCSALPGQVLGRAWIAGIARSPRSADVVHASSFAIPPTGNTPLSVMVHDLAWRNVADAYPAHGRRWHEKALRRALARAAILMVPSNETADDLLRSGAPASRVEVVEEGSDHLPPPDHESAGELLRELDVDGEYLLTASTLEPRKNLGGLIAAYESVIGQLPEPWPLVVVGPTGWGDSRASATAGSRPVYRRITRVGGVPSANESRIVPTGYVSDAVLAALYARARLMAYVPHKEGFGLPVLEAMRAGAPVVASPVPSAGGATFEVDPTDIDSIARGLVDVATDENLRQQLIDAGHQRASKLTWKRAAERHVELWNAMAANRPR